MKEIVKTSRLAGSLEKLFRMLNHDFFENKLPEAVITIQSTPRAYGHFSVNPIWAVGNEDVRHEINLGAGTLDRPIECVVSTLLHEMVHMYCAVVLHEQDTSNNGVFHNARVFKREAEAHGLVCHRNGHHGWSDTSSELSDRLIEWVLTHDIPEIKMNRNEIPPLPVKGTGNKSSEGNPTPPAKKPSNKRIMQCPRCGLKADLHKLAKLICGECVVEMVQVN